MEATLIMPVLLLVVLIGVDFGRLYAAQVTVRDSARQAARYGAANPSDQNASALCGSSLAYWKASVATAQREAEGSPVSIACGAVSLTPSTVPDAFGGQYVTAAVNAPFSFITPFLNPLLTIDHVIASDTAREYPAAALNTSPAAPAAPGSVTATAGNLQATVSWTASAGSAITGYTITPYIGTIAQPSTTVGGTVTSTTISGLTNGVTYTFAVTASNGIGTSPPTTSSPVTPTPTPPPCTFGGEAWAAAVYGVAVAGTNGKLAGVPDATVGDSGALPVAGGSVSNGPLASFSIPGVLGGTVATDQATAASCAGSAASNVASVSILAGKGTGGIDIADISAAAAKTAQACGAAAVQSSSVASVTVAGVTVAILPGVNNQVVSVPGVATVYANTETPGDTTTPPSVDVVKIAFPSTGSLAAQITGTVTVGHAHQSCIYS